MTATNSERGSRVARYLADEAAARDALATHTPEIRARLEAWQEGQSEWFSDTLLEIVAEFITFDDATRQDRITALEREVEGLRFTRPAIEGIEQVCAEEGATVTITGSNPDFNGLPNEVVTIACGASNWEDITFRADTLAECITAAVTFMAEGKCPGCKEVVLNEYRTPQGTCGWCGHDLKAGAPTGFKPAALQPTGGDVGEREGPSATTEIGEITNRRLRVLGEALAARAGGSPFGRC